MNNLPVYLDYRNGRSRILTQIRKIDGDVLVRRNRKIVRLEHVVLGKDLEFVSF